MPPAARPVPRRPAEPRGGPAPRSGGIERLRSGGARRAAAPPAAPVPAAAHHPVVLRGQHRSSSTGTAAGAAARLHDAVTGSPRRRRPQARVGRPAGATLVRHPSVVRALLVLLPATLLAIVGVAGLAAAHPVRASAALRAADNPAADNPVVAAPGVLADRPSAALLRLGRHAARTRSSRSVHRRPLHLWVLPYHGVLTSPFGMRWGRLHAGIDLAGPYGTPIVAATDGCITYAGPMSGYGEVTMIADWDGTETVYGHMSAFAVRSGCVHAGQVIAYIGAAGDATGPHLHFEVRVDGVPVDPIPFLARRGVSV